MKKITCNVELYDWECECCGNGEHFEITIPELNLILSQNDQFGGKLNEEHDDFPEFVEYAMDPGYVINSFEKQGYEVTVNGYEYFKEDYEKD